MKYGVVGICGFLLMVALALHFAGHRPEASWVSLIGLGVATIFTVDAKRRKARK
jgi:hypothetical protein